MHQLTTLSIQIDLMVFLFKKTCFSRKKKTRTCFCGVFSVISFNFVYCCKFVKLVKMCTCLYRKKRKKKDPPYIAHPSFSNFIQPPFFVKNTHIQTHRGANRLAHPYKYIFTPPLMYSQQLPLLHWMNNLLISKIYYLLSLLYGKSHTSVD